MFSKRNILFALVAVSMGVAATQARAGDAGIPDKLIDQIRGWSASPVVLLTLEASNKRHDGLSEDRILELDKQWRAERKTDDQPLITAVLASPLSSYLTAIQAASLGLYTEIFVMDNKGLNAGQSAITSDFWQGDEAKFNETYGMPAGTMHVSDVEFDESAKSYLGQVSLPIIDPDTGQSIGAITVGLNAEMLF